MAKRTLRPRHQEEIKLKIQTSQLVNRLENHAFGLCEMKSTEVDAAKFLLNKTLSNAPTEIDQKNEISGELSFSNLDTKNLTNEQLKAISAIKINSQ